MGWKDKKPFAPIPHWEVGNNPSSWPFKQSKAKPDYDEGDITTHVADPTWRVDPTGPTDRFKHDPCGYWVKFLPDYTTWTFTVEDVASLTTQVLLIEGILRVSIIKYSNPLDSIKSQLDILSGIFKSIVIDYSYSEYVNGSVNFIAGKFDQAHLYDIGIDSINTTNIDIASGIFRESVITQDQPGYNGMTSTITLTGGDYAN